jgi:hypothetical protein
MIRDTTMMQYVKKIDAVAAKKIHDMVLLCEAIASIF